MNKKFNANLVGRIWGSNLTKTQHKQWRTCGKKFRPKYPRSKAYLVLDREWRKLVFRKQNVLTFLPRIFFLWFVYGCASSPGCKQHMKVLVWIFSAQYVLEIKLQNVGQHFTSFGRDSLGSHKIFEKSSRNSFFLKFYVRISTKFGTKHDKFQVRRMIIHPRKKSNSFAQKRTFLFALAVMNRYLFPILGDESGAQISAKTQKTQWRTSGKNFIPKYPRSEA